MSRASDMMEELETRFGPDVGDWLVTVARQRTGLGSPLDVPLKCLRDFRPRTTSGGYNVTKYFPDLYARMWCDMIPDGFDFGHSCRHGPPPHEILVLVLDTEKDELYDALCEMAGYSPPTAEDFVRERARVKADVIERLGAGTDHRELRAYPRLPEGCEVGDRLVDALLDYDEPMKYQDDEFYWDRHTGVVAWVDWGADIDEREDPSDANRYERIEPLEEAEVSLLTDEDLEEIADRFRRSRGFK